MFYIRKVMQCIPQRSSQMYPVQRESPFRHSLRMSGCPCLPSQPAAVCIQRLTYYIQTGHFTARMICCYRKRQKSASASQIKNFHSVPDFDELQNSFQVGAVLCLPVIKISCRKAFFKSLRVLSILALISFCINSYVTALFIFRYL